MIRQKASFENGKLAHQAINQVVDLEVMVLLLRGGKPVINEIKDENGKYQDFVFEFVGFDSVFPITESQVEYCAPSDKFRRVVYKPTIMKLFEDGLLFDARTNKEEKRDIINKFSEMYDNGIYQPLVNRLYRDAYENIKKSVPKHLDFLQDNGYNTKNLQLSLKHAQEFDNERQEYLRDDIVVK